MKSRAVCTAVAVLFLLRGSALMLAQTVAPGNPNPDSTPAASTPADQVTASASRAHDHIYVIGDDDQLEINVWKEPDLCKSVQVRSDGKISLPLVGELQAAGRTPVQLEDDIRSRLLNFITEPAVTVMVQKINSLKFNVMGEVIKPGSYSLATTTTVVDAIATAGGFKDFAKKKSIYVIHTSSDGTETRTSFNYADFVKGKGSHQNILLQAGDTVVVP